MFGKQHYHSRRSPNILFVILRLVLSGVMLLVLLGGLYAAYKQFSGLDPLKLDPLAVAHNVFAARTPQQFIKALPSLKIASKGVSAKKQALDKSVKTDNQSTVLSDQETSKPVAFKFLLVADSHSDNADLIKAINQAKSISPDLQFIIGLGDYSDVGTIGELKKAKKVFDGAGLRYFLIPGDHDLWDCRNRELVPTDCFKEVFGSPYQSFVFENFKFLLLDNSDNYKGFDSNQLQWVTDELEKTKQEGGKGIFVFMHEPLYHPSSDHVMGSVEKSLKTQAGGMIFQLKDAGVKEVLYGDIHYFSQYSEPKTGLNMMTIGAVTVERNPQAPRFAVATVFEDGSIGVEDVEIK